MRRLLTALAAAILAVGLAGCETEVTTSPDEPADEPADGGPDETTPDAGDGGDDGATDEQDTAAIGDAITLRATDDAVQVRVTVDELVDPATPGSEFDDPGEGRRYVGVRVTLENVGGGAYEDSPGNGATLVDADNQQYDEVVVSEGFGECQLLGYQVTMPPGDTRSGCIAFAVPEGATPDRFQFALDSGFGPQTGVWVLAPEG